MPDDLDITYCTHYDCTNHDCMRHPSRIINHSLPRSFSDKEGFMITNEGPKPISIRPMRPMWQGEYNATIGILTIIRDDENGKLSYDDIKRLGYFKEV